MVVVTARGQQLAVRGQGQAADPVGVVAKGAPLLPRPRPHRRQQQRAAARAAARRPIQPGDDAHHATHHQPTRHPAPTAPGWRQFDRHLVLDLVQTHCGSAVTPEGTTDRRIPGSSPASGACLNHEAAKYADPDGLTERPPRPSECRRPSDPRMPRGAVRRRSSPSGASRSSPAVRRHGPGC